MVPDKVIAFNCELNFFLTKLRHPCPLIRQNKGTLNERGDFSFALQMERWSRYLPKGRLEDVNGKMKCVEEITTILQYWYQNRNAEETVDCDSIDDVLKYMMKCSRSWPLVVSRCAVNCGTVAIFLDRKHTFQTVIGPILSIAVPLFALHEDENEVSLSDVRAKLMRNASVKLLEAVGYDVAAECSNSCNCFHLTTKSKVNGLSACQAVICEDVVFSKRHCKEANVKAQEYVRLRCEDMKTMAEHKYDDLTDATAKEDGFLYMLGEVAMKMDLLKIKPSHTVSICIDEDDVKRRMETSCRGAAFALYNCARLSALLRQFEEKVQSDCYPPLIPFEEVDFSLLSKEEEWELVFSHLLMYPHVLNRATMNATKGEIFPNLICKFIVDLCSCFSLYYRRVRILTEGRIHLLPVMFARLHLLQAIKEVLYNALEILEISPVSKM
ncbi:hypothetical protein C0J52_26415 [Blattella germanica]|nr:hypothetical protein C0J52_26415 [Blattella germanica]